MKRFGWEAILIFVLGWAAIAPVTARAAENPAIPDTQLEVATFAGGCFWCMVPPFAKLAGVVSVTSGYTGGHVKDPTYEQVSAGGTGHADGETQIYAHHKTI